MSVNKRRKKQNRGNIWLVDYDQSKKKACRSRLYRKLKTPKYKPLGKSTNSVLLFDKQKTAEAVHNKASKCGNANIYKVVKRSKRKAK